MLTSAAILGLVAATAASAPARPSVDHGSNDAGAFRSPHDALELQGVPKVPVALAERAERYAAFRTASFRDWHPTRRELLIVTRFGEASQVHRVAAPLGMRTQLTFGAGPVQTGIASLPDDAVLFSRDVGGDERFQLFRQAADGAVTRLTDGASRNTDPVVSPSGRLVAYGSTRRNGADVDVWISSTTDGATARLLAPLSGGGWAPLAFSLDESKLLAGNFRSSSDAELVVFDVATGEKAPLANGAKGAPEAFGKRARFSPDGRAVYVTCDGGADFLRLVRIELANGRRTALTAHLSADVEAFDLSPDGKTLVFATNDRGFSTLRSLDLASRVERPVKDQPKGVIGDLRFHRNGRDLALNVSSNRLGGDVHVLNVARNVVERWTKSETGGFDVSRFSDATLVEWPSFDGLRITGFLFRPPAARFPGKRPVFIELHGGPEAQWRPQSLGRLNYLVEELGVAVLAPNVRGSTGFGRAFHRLDDGLQREGAIRDVGALLEWIAQQTELDAGRVMVAGGSYGGFLSLATAIEYGARLRGAIDVVGPSNLVTFLENTSPYRRDLRRVEYGDERDPTVRAFLERIAPARRAAALKIPLFVLQGANDPRVPASEAAQMVATVRQNGAPVWSLVARDEGHGFAKKQNADYAFWTQLLFVEAHLLGP